jgi:hypothetical protein
MPNPSPRLPSRLQRSSVCAPALRWAWGGSLLFRAAAGGARDRSPMRNFVLLSDGIGPWSGSSRLRPAAWHGVHPLLSARRLRVNRKSLPTLRKVVPSIRAGASIRHRRASPASAGHRVSAWHGVLRSEVGMQKPEIGMRTAEVPRPSGRADAPRQDPFWLLSSGSCPLVPAGHGVDRSFLRFAPRPAAVPSPELT